MSDTTQIKIFLSNLIRPIVDDAVNDALRKHLSTTATTPIGQAWYPLEAFCEKTHTSPATAYRHAEKWGAVKRNGKWWFPASFTDNFFEQQKTA